MANKLIPWQRYLSDIAHKYVGYPDDEDEEGGEDTMLTVNMDTETNTLDKTFAEIVEAAENGYVVAKYDNSEFGNVMFMPLATIYLPVDGSGTPILLFMCDNTDGGVWLKEFTAESVNDYPVTN